MDVPGSEFGENGLFLFADCALEIQPTSDADQRYPAIHQGLPCAWRDLREDKPKLFGEDDAAQ